MFDYEIKIAQTDEEVAAAQKLRFEVFNIEKGLADVSDRQSLDKDRYDPFCDHLIVIDKKNSNLVGTYRFLLSSKVDPKIGFHSEEIFNLDDLKNKRSNLLEMGRSCVHKDYRNSLVINLLWSGIAAYTKMHNVDYIFGCTRLDSTSPKVISESFCLLRDHYSVNGEFKILPRPENAIDNLNRDCKIDNPRKLFRKLPPLLKGYLYSGAKVCGEPAVNKEFGSIVFFLILKTDDINENYRKRFLESSLQIKTSFYDQANS